MMKPFLTLAFLASTLVLGGCATAPQPPVALSNNVFSGSGGRIGVAMYELPKVDTSFPGASCLLCLAAASLANSSLTTYTQTLPSDDLAHLKADVAELLRKKGQQVTVIDDAFKLDQFPKGDGAPNKSPRDFSSLRAKYNINKLLVVNITQLGIRRSYAAYIPSSDPQSVVMGNGYLVNLADNNLEWYAPIEEVKSASGKWDEAPKYPGLTNAYFQAIEGARDVVLKPFEQ
jgi:hypothetical protein